MKGIVHQKSQSLIYLRRWNGGKILGARSGFFHNFAKFKLGLTHRLRAMIIQKPKKITESYVLTHFSFLFQVWKYANVYKSF